MGDYRAHQNLRTERYCSNESLFTERFSKLGYRPDVYLSADRYGSHYPAILDLDETLIDRSPLFKRQALFSDPRFMEHYAGDIPRALKVLKETSDYDENLIWRNVLRSAELRNLNTNAALTSVLPDVRLKQDKAPPECGRIAVCAHIYYTDMLPEMLSLAENIPVPFDFIATTNTEEKRQEIEQAARQRPGVDKVIVRVVEQNRGRDMSSLFITCRDLFLDDTYELVCRIHSKKSPQVASTQGSLFKRHMFENLLNSKGYVSNVIDMFHDNPWIGVALPPLIHISYWTMGHAWYSNRKKTNEIAELLGLKLWLPLTGTPRSAPSARIFGSAPGLCESFSNTNGNGRISTWSPTMSMAGWRTRSSASSAMSRKTPAIRRSRSYPPIRPGRTTPCSNISCSAFRRRCRWADFTYITAGCSMIGRRLPAIPQLGGRLSARIGVVGGGRARHGDQEILLAYRLAIDRQSAEADKARPPFPIEVKARRFGRLQGRQALVSAARRPSIQRQRAATPASTLQCGFQLSSAIARLMSHEAWRTSPLRKAPLIWGAGAP